MTYTRSTLQSSLSHDDAVCAFNALCNHVTDRAYIRKADALFSQIKIYPEAEKTHSASAVAFCLLHVRPSLQQGLSKKRIGILYKRV